MSTLHPHDVVVPEAGLPTPPAEPPRRNRAVVVLSAVLALLVAALAVLAVLLMNERGAAADRAVAEAAEDRAHEQALTDLEEQRGHVEEDLWAVESAARDAQGRIDAAEAAKQAAEDEVAAREQAAADAIAADEQTFVDLMRDDMPGVPDAELVARGRDVCTFLDSNGGDVFAAIDRAEATYGEDVAIPLAAAAVVMFCPEYE